MTRLALPQSRAAGAATESAGRPLEPAMRADLEARLGQDFSGVRVHRVPEAADGIGARAYAHGEHVVMGSAAPEAGSLGERRLLAHELAHVVQQRRGSPTDRHDDVESAAEHAAHAVAANEGHVEVGGRSPVGIARDEVAEVPKHDVAFVPAEAGFTNLKIDGVAVLRYANPENPADIAVGTEWSGDAPKLIRIGIRRQASVSALLNLEGVQELKRRGYDVIAYDQMLPAKLGELDDVTVRAVGPPPNRRRAAKPPEHVADKKAPPVQTVTPLDAPVDLAPLPVDTQPAVPPQQTPKDLIDARTSWWNDLDEDALGSDLLARAATGDPDYAQSVLDEVGSTDRDDVSLAFAAAATDEQLRQLAQTDRGRHLLDRLYDELTAGEVFADEQKQADRILAVKTQSLLTEDQYAAGIAKAQGRHGIILPYRKPGITVLTPSPIYARRLGDGKIAVHVRHDIFGTDYARDRDLRLPPDIWDQVILNETDIVGIKRYDDGGTIDYVPALSLVGLENESTRIAYEKAAEAFGTGLTLGIGGGAAAGGEATAESTTLSTGARLLAGARKGVVIADHALTAIEVGNSIIGEHRGWIIETWPAEGREVVQSIDAIASYARYYGIVRGGLGIAQLGNNLRKSYRNWRAATAALKGLSDSELADVEKIGSDLERVIQEIGAADPAGTASSDAAPVVDAAATGDVANITSAKGRTYPAQTARKLAATPEGAGEVLRLNVDAAAQDVVADKAAHVAANAASGFEEQPLLRASGDDVRASAGSRRGSPVTPAVPTNAPARGASRGGVVTGPPPPRAPLRRAPVPEHLDEPKLHPGDVNKVPADAAYDFFRKNRSTYPKRVQDLIDDVKTPTKSANAAIDRELRLDYAQRANRALGFPGGHILEESAPFTTSTKGHALGSEGKEFEAGISPTPGGDRKNLNLVGHTKSGEILDLDDFNFRDRSGEEIKMPDALQNDPRFRAAGEAKIVSELRRHYEFTRDWKFNPYRWNLHTYGDYHYVRHLVQEYLPADWEQYLKITWVQ